MSNFVMDLGVRMENVLAPQVNAGSLTFLRVGCEETEFRKFILILLVRGDDGGKLACLAIH